ncbi:hypothetical protein ABGB18_08035 [Nonomuraea sp. B12E4]|uniref:hypothetical protein n=1 Tax=Nonomuraea sp. B12E4 TaxID=3153564 RepID=UPI00325F2A6C
MLEPALAGAALPGPLLDAVLDAVLDAGRPEALGVLARSEALIAARPGLRDVLAATGYAEVARVAIPWHRSGQKAWPLRARRSVLAAARGSGWQGSQGVLTGLLKASEPERLRAAVVCPLPEAARTALKRAGRALTRAEQLRALLTVHDHEGAAAALALLGEVPGLRPEVIETVREADAGALRKAVELAEGTDGLIEELYDDRLPQREEHLALRDLVDWDAIAAADADRPFDETATALLAARPDCPDELRAAWYQVRGVAVATHSARLDPGLLALTPGGPRAARAVGLLVRRGLDSGFTAAQVLESARPAAAVLEAVRQPPGGGGAWNDLASRLADLVRDRLGADVEAWRAVRALLSRFGGTVPELLDEAAARAAAGPKPKSGGWPGAAAMPAGERSASVTGARAAFLTLLDAAPAATHAALLAQLDDRTVCDLFGHGRWRPEWIDLVMATRDTRHVRVLANRGSLGAEAIELLMRLDDPVVNGRLFRRTGATGPQRERLLSGRPVREDATEPLPLPAELVKELMGRTSGWRARDAVNCADPELQRHILSHVRVRGIVPQSRMLLNLWERHGVAKVIDLLDNEPPAVSHTRRVIRREVRGTMRRLLAGKDRDAALAELRAQVVAGETAEWQITELRGQHFSGAELFREAHPWHWEELLAEHARDPLPPLVLAGLSRIPECPEELRAESAELGDYDTPGEVLLWLEEGRTPQEILRARAVSHDLGTWVRQAIKYGGLTWDDVLEYGHPARQVLTVWGGERLRSPLTRLVRDNLDPSPEAWVLALRMLPGFTGSVAELARTAAAATGVAPRPHTETK